MTNSIFGQGFAKANEYPAGLMNTCPCGQVVLAPKTIHDRCEATHTYCSNCHGKGEVYVGNGEDFTIEPCVV